MNLYEIQYELRECLEQIMDFAEQNEGEIPEELSKKIDTLTIQKDQKIKGLIYYFKELKANAEIITVEKYRLHEKLRTVENNIDWIRRTLSTVLDGEKYKDALVNVYYSSSKKTIVPEDINEIPEQYHKVKREADITAIKKDIEAGIEIAGCYIQESKNIVIR